MTLSLPRTARSALDLLDAFDLLGFAAIVVDGRGSVLDRNRHAEALWPTAVGLGDQFDDRQAAAVETLVAAAGTMPRPTACAPITLQRPRGRLLIVHVALMTGTGAVLILIDPDAVREPSAALLRSAFGLTRSEVDLAHHLCLGRALKDIARHRQTSVATLRVQLRAIFAKTRTRRQAELVALLTRLPPGLEAIANG